MISQKPMLLGSPNVKQKRSTIIPGKPFILSSKGQRSRGIKIVGVGPGVLVYAGLF